MKKIYFIAIVMLGCLTTPLFAQYEETTLESIEYPCQTSDFAKHAHLITFGDFNRVLSWIIRVYGYESPQMDSITPDPDIWEAAYGFSFDGKNPRFPPQFLWINGNLPVKGIRACNIPFFIRSYNSFIRETFEDTNTYRLAAKEDYNPIFIDGTYVNDIMGPEILAITPGLPDNVASIAGIQETPGVSSFNIMNETSGEYYFRIVLTQ